MMPSQNGFANAVRQQVQQLPNVAMTRAGAMPSVRGPQAAGAGATVPSSPKRLATAGGSSSSGGTPGANPSASPANPAATAGKTGAVRALFTDKAKNSSPAAPKSTTGTYTQASMAKTKVVTSTMPTTFAAKVSYFSSVFFGQFVSLAQSEGVRLPLRRKNCWKAVLLHILLEKEQRRKGKSISCIVC